MLGVAPATVRTWEGRYRLVKPERSAGGHRLYTRDQVEQLRFVKSKLDAGIPAATAHRLLAERLSDHGVARNQRSKGPRVLILLAERDRYAAEFEEYFLRTEGYDVELLFDADEAMRKSAELLPRLVIVDLLISGGVGLDLCRRLKAQTTAAVLALSPLAARDEALAAGADAFLQKPIDPLQLASATKDLLLTSAFLR
jgi:DNA-binding transcriptional MerR regulator